MAPRKEPFKKTPYLHFDEQIKYKKIHLTLLYTITLKKVTVA